MIKLALAYIATAAAFFALDLLWLGIVARDFYRSALGSLLLERPNMVAAAVFYSMYVVGIVIFAVAPAMAAESWVKAAALGALFGFFAYATYDMTNFVTLKNWPLSVVLVDITWGTILTGTSAAIGYAVTSWILR